MNFQKFIYDFLKFNDFSANFHDILTHAEALKSGEMGLCHTVPLTLSPPLVAPHAFSATALLRLAMPSAFGVQLRVARAQGVAVITLAYAFRVPRFQRDYAATARDHFVVSLAALVSPPACAMSSLRDYRLSWSGDMVQVEPAELQETALRAAEPHKTPVTGALADIKQPSGLRVRRG